jgi:hypothetical protein
MAQQGVKLLLSLDRAVTVESSYGKGESRDTTTAAASKDLDVEMATGEDHHNQYG